MRKLIAISTVALSSALILSGCTSAAPTPTRSTAAEMIQTPAPTLPEGVTQETDVPADVPNDPEARKNVTLDDCFAIDGGWTASGTAANDTDASKDYTITVFFTTDSATVLHTQSAVVTVEPAGQIDWAVDGDFTAPTGTLCVLRGVA